MRSLDISQKLLTFDGQPFKKDEKDDLTLRDVLLRYIVSVNEMETTPKHRTGLYTAGLKIGTAKESVELTTEEHEAIAAMCEEPKVNNGKERVYLFTFPITEQVKKMVEEADVVKETKSKE